jgi:hypothetical protein
MKKKRENSKFCKTVAKCAKEVSKWPKWKQRYVITAEAAMTGKFIK